ARGATADDHGDSRPNRSRRPDLLWVERSRPLAARRRAGRQDPARGEARRLAGRAADQVRSHHQSDHRRGARPDHPANAARSRRRGDRMNRREFITLLAGATALPLTANAQQRVRRVAVLMSTTPDEPESQARITALAQGLQEAGWLVGSNVRIDVRWSGGDF